MTTTTSSRREMPLPRTAIVIAATAAMLGIIYGYDNGVIGAAQLYFERPDQLNLNTAQIERVTAAIIWGEIIGALVGGWLINRIGRKKTMLMLTMGYLVFCLASALSWNLRTLVAARFGLGLAIGLSLIAVPVYVAESVPARIRGGSLVLYQVMGVCGIILGFGFSLALSAANPDWNWRLMLGLASIPALLLLPVIFRLPETARWYFMKDRFDEALAALKRIDPDGDHAAETAEMRAAQVAESGGALREMIHRPYLRATIFVVVLGFLIQITGINATISYGPKIFEAMGITSNSQSILMAMLVQVFALVAVLCSMRYIDRWGRRPVLLTGIGVMIVSQLALVLVFGTAKSDDEFAGWQVAVGFAGLAIFNMGFVFGFGSLVWVYSSEAFPSRLRAYGSSAMLTADLVGNYLIVAFFLTAMTGIGGAGSFLIFAVLSALAFVFVFKLAPETKGRDLDEIRDYWENGGKWPVAPSTVASTAGLKGNE